jgi:predicted Rdx family selenoprotein
MTSLTYQWYYDFTVRGGFVAVRLLQLFSQDSMIVYLAVDGQGYTPIVVDKRLSARI